MQISLCSSCPMLPMKKIKCHPPPKLFLMLIIHVIDDKLCKLGHIHHRGIMGALDAPMMGQQ